MKKYKIWKKILLRAKLKVYLYLMPNKSYMGVSKNWKRKGNHFLCVRFFIKKKSESFAFQFAFWVSYSFSGQALFINFRRGWTANFNGFYHAFFIASTHFFCIGIEIRLWSFKIECQMNRIKKPSCSSLIFCLCFLQSSVALAPCI